MRPPLEWMLFAVAIASAIATRVVQKCTRGLSATTVRAAAPVLVLVAAPAQATWNETLWHCVRTAANPRALRFGMLLECSCLDDANVDVDSVLRPHVRVVHEPVGRAREPPAQLARMVKRFVDGSESVVVVLDMAARTRPLWDATAIALCSYVPAGVVLSTPSRSTARAHGHFPCISPAGSRGASTPFLAPDTVSVATATCWCAEMTLLSAGAARACLHPEWHRSVAHMVPTTALLEDDEALEARVVRRCASIVATTSRRAAVGLVPGADAAEDIAKFGTVRAARLAIRFGGHPSLTTAS